MLESLIDRDQFATAMIIMARLTPYYYQYCRKINPDMYVSIHKLTQEQFRQDYGLQRQ